MKTILIVEDEKDITEAISYSLSKEGYKVYKAYDGVSGLKAAQDKIPDIILLDLMLPLMAGTEVCKILKKSPSTSNIPIIMLSAKSEEIDKVLGLELGADDYVTKPFGMKELAARIKAVLKRYSEIEVTSTKKILFPDLEIDIEKHAVKSSGNSVELTAKEFALLTYLANNKGKIFGRDRILDNVWGIDVAIETRTVDVHVRSLRKKLKKAGRYIQTIIGVGYKFLDKESI